MAGKAIERKSTELTSRVNVVESQTSVQTVRGKYGKDAAGNRITLVEGKSELRPYKYFELLEGKMSTIRNVQDALADVVAAEHGNYPIAQLVADINHGMEYRGRASWALGVDPSTTPKQRETLERVQGLMDDGLIDYEMAAVMLTKVGLTPDQIAANLG